MGSEDIWLFKENLSADDTDATIPAVAVQGVVVAVVTDVVCADKEILAIRATCDGT